MTTQPIESDAMPKGSTSWVTMLYGTIIFAISSGIWVYGQTQHFDVSAIWTVATPVIMFLFLGEGLASVAQGVKQVTTQTNGTLDQRIKSATASALAERDATKTNVILTGAADKAAKTAENAPA